jgi:hypothetical protein
METPTLLGPTERDNINHWTEGQKPSISGLCTTVRMDLGEVGWSDVHWIDLAKDRNRWRAVVNSVLNLRVPWNPGKLSSGLASSGLSSIELVSYTPPSEPFRFYVIPSLDKNDPPAWDGQPIGADRTGLWFEHRGSIRMGGVTPWLPATRIAVKHVTTLQSLRVRGAENSFPRCPATQHIDRGLDSPLRRCRRIVTLFAACLPGRLLSSRLHRNLKTHSHVMIMVLCPVTPSSLVGDYRRFGTIYGFHNSS